MQSKEFVEKISEEVEGRNKKYVKEEMEKFRSAMSKKLDEIEVKLSEK